jgi:hypothetical protein
MLVQERFFHVMSNVKSRRYNGATTLVVGNYNGVAVSTAYCSLKDQFNRKVGRFTAERNTIWQSIALRDLPKYLAEVECKVHNYKLEDVRFMIDDYNYAIKYFLPK